MRIVKLVGQPYFTHIVAEGPAEKAGIEEGDILLELGGVKVTTRKGFIDELKKYKPGDKVEVKVERLKKEEDKKSKKKSAKKDKGKKTVIKTLTLELGERPRQRGRR